jgi:predicted small secreted protein
VRRVLLAILLAAAAALTTSCGPDEPEGPDLKDFALVR